MIQYSVQEYTGYHCLDQIQNYTWRIKGIHIFPVLLNTSSMSPIMCEIHLNSGLAEIMAPGLVNSKRLFLKRHVKNPFCDSLTLLFLLPAAVLQVLDVVVLDRLLQLVQRRSAVFLLEPLVYVIRYAHVLRFPGHHQPHGPEIPA